MTAKRPWSRGSHEGLHGLHSFRWLSTRLYCSLVMNRRRKKHLLNSRVHFQWLHEHLQGSSPPILLSKLCRWHWKATTTHLTHSLGPWLLSNPCYTVFWLSHWIPLISVCGTVLSISFPNPHPSHPPPPPPACPSQAVTPTNTHNIEGWEESPHEHHLHAVGLAQGSPPGLCLTPTLKFTILQCQ